MTGFVDRQRAARLMREAGIDALVLCAPEAFHYATGVSMGRRDFSGELVLALSSSPPGRICRSAS